LSRQSHESIRHPAVPSNRRLGAERRERESNVVLHRLYPPPWATVADHRPFQKTAAILQQPRFPGLKSHRQQTPRPADPDGRLVVVLLKARVSHPMQGHLLLWLQRYASISFTFSWWPPDLAQRRHNEAGKGGKLSNQLAADRGKSLQQHLKDASMERQAQADQPALAWD
jgi:hypothetical protein